MLPLRPSILLVFLSIELSNPLPAQLSVRANIPSHADALSAPDTLSRPDTPSPLQLSVRTGAHPTPLEDYAAKELCRYIHAVSGCLPIIIPIATQPTATTTSSPSTASIPTTGFIIGCIGHHPFIDRMLEKALLKKPSGAQGYTIKKIELDNKPCIVIAGKDETGLLYGVYGFLEEHLGISFSFEGDILPAKIPPTALFPDLDETKTPAVPIRGFLPWTNFPQSATSYSWEDWKYILDQAAKMRMNFLQIHNYSGEEGHNEMFHDFEADGKLSRVWMATARSGHAWGSYPGWDPNKYLFGSSALFDDYDFGADCTLHNEGLDNRQVFRKGAGEFQRIIAYAHQRGIRIGLGLDINLIPDTYRLNPDDPKVIAARVKQIETDYPGLDYLLCFQSEGLSDPSAGAARASWRKIFDGFYNGLKKTLPTLRFAVAGWGIRAEDVATLPEDVICAPISYYSDGCETGAAYGKREYWGCPWLERDFNSSVYYYPYNMNISRTIRAWQNRAPNMRGFYALTWRITDAIKAKIGFLARAAWDDKNELRNSEALYKKFAEQEYGPAAAPLLTPIINEDEPFASEFSECRWTPPFSLNRVETGGWLTNLFSFSSGDTTILATNFSESFQAQKVPAGPDQKQCVGYLTTGSWLAYDNIRFDTTTTALTFTIASPGGIAHLEIRTDTPDGPLIGAGNLPRTESWQQWTRVTIPINWPFNTAVRSHYIRTPHRLFLVFRESDPLARAQIQLSKADTDLKIIADAEALATDPGQRYRISLLKDRIGAERDHIRLNIFAGNRHYDIAELTRSWVSHFNSRVTDISSLGNVVSVQDRFIQNNYSELAWRQLNTYNTLAPENIEARGTRSGAVVRWKTAGIHYRGFEVYRDGVKITGTPLPSDTREYSDTTAGAHRYEVFSLFWGNDNPNASMDATALAGSADTIPPQIVLISPPGSVIAGQSAWIKAHLLDNRSDELLSATLYYRAVASNRGTPDNDRGNSSIPSPGWIAIPMTRRIRSTFTAVLPADKIDAKGIEYYISATDGDNTGVFPADAPVHPLSLIRVQEPGLPRDSEPSLRASRSAPVLMHPTVLVHAPSASPILNWRPIRGAAYYRVYRSNRRSFTPGPDSYLTFLAADAALHFTDNGMDLGGQPLKGSWTYCVTAVDRHGFETPPSAKTTLVYP